MSDLERVAIAMRHRYAEMTNDLPLVPFEQSQARAAWLECARVAIETMGADDTLWQRENHDLVEEKAALRAANDRLREALEKIKVRAEGYEHGDSQVTAAFRGITTIARAALYGA